MAFSPAGVIVIGGVQVCRCTGGGGLKAMCQPVSREVALWHSVRVLSYAYRYPMSSRIKVPCPIPYSTPVVNVLLCILECR
jgi:hypothetical protein